MPSELILVLLRASLKTFALLTPTGGVTSEPHLEYVVYKMPQESHCIHTGFFS